MSFPTSVTFLRPSLLLKHLRLRHVFVHPRYKRVRQAGFGIVISLTLCFVFVFFIFRLSRRKSIYEQSSSSWVSLHGNMDISFNNLEWVPLDEIENFRNQTFPSYSLNESTLSFPTFDNLLNHSRPVSHQKFIPKAKACVFYDAPPRTGAEVIAPALQKCLQSRGFRTLGVDRHGNVDWFRGSESSDPDSYFTSLRSLLASMSHVSAAANTSRSQTIALASVSLPLIFSPEDLTVIDNVCESVMYVSSARPMAHRLTDALWHDVHAQRSENDPLALSVAAAINTNAMARVERAYNAFPWITRRKRMASKPNRQATQTDSRRLTGLHDRNVKPPQYSNFRPWPDYIITETDFSIHLKNLLEAFGCQTETSTSRSRTSLISWFPSSSFVAPAAKTIVPFHSISNLTHPFYVPRRVSGKDVVIDRVAANLQSNDDTFKIMSAIAHRKNLANGINLAKYLLYAVSRTSDHLKIRHSR